MVDLLVEGDEISEPSPAEVGEHVDEGTQAIEAVQTQEVLDGAEIEGGLVEDAAVALPRRIHYQPLETRAFQVGFFLIPAYREREEQLSPRLLDTEEQLVNQ